MGSHDGNVEIGDDEPVTVIDTETTGLDVKAGERIRSIAYVQGTLAGGMSAKGIFILDTGGRLSGPEAFRVHRIRNDDPRQVPARQGMSAILAIVAAGGPPDAGVAIMHNADFDMGFIDDALAREGLGPQRWRVQDTMRISLGRNPTRHANLDALAKEHGLDASLIQRRKERHDAQDDCLLTFELWRRIVRPMTLDLAGAGAPGAAAVAEAARGQRTPELDW